jgi:excinuclease ABC subunit B
MQASKKTSESQKSRPFELVAPYEPSGDQGRVIDNIIKSLKQKNFEQTILGATGTGKTYMMASIVNNLQKPTLVIAHNKTLAAQLAEEFKRFFPNNAVHYFVSYYDYYQPESYIPRSDTYIEKQTQINEEIERLRNATTQALLTRKDVLIVASVSCIYGLGNPEDFQSLKIELEVGHNYKLQKILRKLIDLQFSRTDADLSRGRFRIRGDTLEIYPTAEEKVGYRFSFFGDELEKIESFDIVTAQEIDSIDTYTIFPAKQYVTTAEKIQKAIQTIEQDLLSQVDYFEGDGKLLQAQRIKDRTMNDLEMLETLGYVGGIENYSSYFDGRKDGEPPATLLDYFPDDSLTFVDESHITLSQIGAMYNGDRSRKTTLVEYGFRLPSALNNRPLRINEFFNNQSQLIYVSATPGEFELGNRDFISKEKIEHRKGEITKILTEEAIIRPTGLIDPEIQLKPVKNQVDDVLEEVRKRVVKGQRVLITTLTKKFAEELDLYFKQINVKSAYIHSDVDTMERVEILSDLRRGKYDVLIGINLLREGLDLPEVSLVAIFDADKEGFLRSKTSLVQIIGRAARHEEGKVIMYAENITGSMQYAIDETNRRRGLQTEYNKIHGITPRSTKRELETIVDDLREEIEQNEDYGKAGAVLTPQGFQKMDEFVEVGRKKDKNRDESIYEIQNKSVHGGDTTQKTRKPKKAKQVYDDFETTKKGYFEELLEKNYTQEKLEEILQKAVDDMDFEKAAAIRDVLEY